MEHHPCIIFYSAIPSLSFTSTSKSKPNLFCGTQSWKCLTVAEIKYYTSVLTTRPAVTTNMQEVWISNTIYNIWNNNDCRERLFLDTNCKQSWITSVNNCSMEPQRNRCRWLRVLLIASILLYVRKIALKAWSFSNLESKEFLTTIFLDSQVFSVLGIKSQVLQPWARLRN